MKKLYRLEHLHNTDGYDQELYIGLFSSIEEVEKAIEQLIDQPGFKNHPRECFRISEKKVDMFEWKNGFETISGKDVEILS